MKGVSFDNFWSWGKAWTPKLDPSHWLSHHKAEHKNQMFLIFQGTSIFKIILPQERIRAGSQGGVDVTDSSFSNADVGWTRFNELNAKGAGGGLWLQSEVEKHQQQNFSRKAILLFSVEICTFNSSLLFLWLLHSLKSVRPNFELAGWVGREKSIKTCI